MSSQAGCSFIDLMVGFIHLLIRVLPGFVLNVVKCCRASGQELEEHKRSVEGEVMFSCPGRTVGCWER